MSILFNKNVFEDLVVVIFKVPTLSQEELSKRPISNYTYFFTMLANNVVYK